MTPRVAIVTPTKNRLELLRQALDSVRVQTFADWEHLVVDDGSDDGTAEEMAARTAADPRVRYIQRTGQAGGANVCRNIGVRDAAADFIVFLDSDDLLEPDCLARRVEVMDRNADIDFATFQTSVFVETPNDLNRPVATDLMGDDLVQFLYFELPWIITAPIWRKAALTRLGLFDETLPSWQDVELHIRALTAGCRYLRFPAVDHHVRWQWEDTKVSVEQRRSPRHLTAANTIIETFEQRVRQGPGMNWVRQRALCSLYFFVAERWLEIGKTREALACWRQIRQRGLGSAMLHGQGALLLRLRAPGSPVRKLGERLTHKWKGWARLRTNPELVAP
jgi:hypothetical protein